MSFPSIRFRVGFDSDPLDDTPSLTDLSTRVEGFSYSYGKQNALDDFQPGTSTVRLRNDDRELDPLHATGPYFGKLKPRKRCVLDVTYNAVTYDQFTTFADGWPQKYAPPSISEVELNGTDLFVLLANIVLGGSTWEVITRQIPGKRSWWRLGETTDSQEAIDQQGLRNLDYYGVPVLEQPSLITGDDDTAVVLYPNSRATTADPDPSLTGDFTVVLWVRRNGVSGAAEYIAMQGLSPASRWMLYMGTVGDIYFTVFNSNGDGGTTADLNSWADDRPHMIMVRKDDADISISIDDGTVATVTLASAFGVSPGQFTVGAFMPGASQRFQGTIDEIVTFDRALTTAEITSLYEAGGTAWSGDTTGERIDRILDYAGVLSGDRDIDTGITILGSTTLGVDALTGAQAVNLTENGDFYVEHRNAGKLTFNDRTVRYTATRSTVVQAVFTDDPAAGPGAYRFEPDDLVLTDDESQIVNEAVVLWDQGEMRFEDSASVAAHGRKSRTYATQLKTAQEARAYAEWQVGLFKDPHVRVESLTLNPAADDDLWVPALSLRYGDRVTFRFHPQGVGTAIETDYLIQGLNVEADNGVSSWLTTFYLSPASQSGGDYEVFILDDSLMDGDAVLVF